MFAALPLHTVEFTSWLEAFVRESNALSGIERDPTPAEVAAHKGLLAVLTLSVENLQVFVQHLEADATLRTEGEADAEPGRDHGCEMYADLRTIVCAAQSGVWPPPRLHDLYVQLRPFSDANRRSARALWLWQSLKRRAEIGIHSEGEAQHLSHQAQVYHS